MRHVMALVEVPRQIGILAQHLTKAVLLLSQGDIRTHLLEHIRADEVDELGRTLTGNNGS